MPKPRILVIDDNPEITNLAQIILSAEGYDVYTALESRTAMSTALQNPPDLILLDYMMPGKDGISLLKDIRAFPDLTDVPVILVTASGAPDTVKLAIAHKVVDFVVKPFDVNLLVERVKKYLPPPPKLD